MPRNPDRPRDTARADCVDAWECRRDGRLIVVVRVTSRGLLRVLRPHAGKGLACGDREYAAAWLNDRLPALSHDDCYRELWGE